MEWSEYQPSVPKVAMIRSADKDPVEPGDAVKPYASGSMPCGDRSARMLAKDTSGDILW